MKDNSARTKVVSQPYKMTVTSIVLIVVSILIYTIGLTHYNNIVNNSSTAIGSVLEFKRSNASITLSGLYTDQSRSVLIARFSVDKTSSSRLPSDGKDYKLFVSSNSALKSSDNVSMLFGRLSTDGDMFLVLPKPAKKTVYSVFVMNTVYLSPGDSKNSKSSSVLASSKDIEDAEKSVTESLSSYKYNPDKANDPYSISSDTTDMVSMRLTLDPALNDAAHKPVVLDTTLLNGTTFDFKGMFDILFKKSAYEELEKEHSKLTVESEQTTKVADEFKNRLVRNPNDATAAEQFTKAKDSLKSIEQKKQEVAAQLTAYESLEYTDDMFNNIQTTAKVVHVR